MSSTNKKATKSKSSASSLPLQVNSLSSEPTNQTSTSKQKVKKSSSSSTKLTRTKRAGITFPVSRVDQLLRERGFTTRVSREAPVYMAAVLEYLVLEILELGMSVCHQNKKTRITPQHINWAITNDLELNELFKDITIASGGVLPQTIQYPASKSKKKSSSKPKDSAVIKPSMKSNEDDSDQDNVGEDDLSQSF